MKASKIQWGKSSAKLTKKKKKARFPISEEFKDDEEQQEEEEEENISGGRYWSVNLNTTACLLNFANEIGITLTITIKIKIGVRAIDQQ